MPGCRASKSNSPLSFVFTVLTAPLFTSVMVTVAPGTAALLWSVMVPSMLPLAAWAMLAAGKAMKAAALAISPRLTPLRAREPRKRVV